MTAQQIIELVYMDMDAMPDISGMSLIEQVFCMGIYRVYKMYSIGVIDKEQGRRLKLELIREFEHWQLFEEIYTRHIENRKKACVAGVKLTKLLQNYAPDSQILDTALEVLNLSGLSGGVDWKRRVD